MENQTHHNHWMFRGHSASQFRAAGLASHYVERDKKSGPVLGIHFRLSIRKVEIPKSAKSSASPISPRHLESPPSHSTTPIPHPPHITYWTNMSSANVTDTPTKGPIMGPMMDDARCPCTNPSQSIQIKDGNTHVQQQAAATIGTASSRYLTRLIPKMCRSSLCAPQHVTKQAGRGFGRILTS